MFLKTKWLSFLLSAILLFTFESAAYGAGSSPLQLFVDGKRVLADNTPLADKTGVFVPFKPAFEKLGFTVGYDAKTKMNTAQKQGLKISLAAGSKTALVNGKKKALSAAPKNVGTIFYVSIKTVTETAGAPAVYNAAQGTIQVGKAVILDDYFRLNWGMTPDQVKKAETRKLAASGKDEDGSTYLTYATVLPTGEAGAYHYVFVNGKLARFFVVGEGSPEFDETVDVYIDLKESLEKLYNKGEAQNDVYWDAEDDVLQAYQDKYDAEEDSYPEAMANGDLYFMGSYDYLDRHISIVMENHGEPENPDYNYVIVYQKK